MQACTGGHVRLLPEGWESGLHTGCAGVDHTGMQAFLLHTSPSAGAWLPSQGLASLEKGWPWIHSALEERTSRER